MPQQYSLQECERIALAFARSGFFEDSREASQAFAKIVIGREYGMGPGESMLSLYLTKQKKVGFMASMIAARIKRSGIYDFRRSWLTRDTQTKAVVPMTDLAQKVVGCRLDFFEDGEFVGDSTFTDEDAARAGLTDKDNYKAYPRNMFFARALTNGARWYCGEVFAGGVHTPDELDPDAQLDSSGRPTNWEQRHALPAPNAGDPAPTEPAAPPPRKALGIKDLRALYVEALLPEGKFVEWLEMMVDFKQEAGVDGKLIPPSGEQRMKAEDELRKIIAERNPPTEPEAAPPPAEREIADDESEAPPPAAENAEVQQASLAFAEQTGADVGISDGQRKLIMAMFNDRKAALVAMYPELKTADARRHEFAAKALKNDAKRSSKNWTPSDFKVVHDKLELVPPDATE
jgi:hypothetical protein